MLILDADGKPLITSDAAEGNIGYPGQPKEITHFGKILRTNGPASLRQRDQAAAG